MYLNKQETVARLTVKLAEAKEIDEKALVAHYAKNKGVAGQRRKYLEGLLKLTDDKLAEISVYEMRDRLGQLISSCPISQAAAIETELAWVALIADETIQTRNDSQLVKVLQRSLKNAALC